MQVTNNKFEDYITHQIEDARKILNAYISLPQNKRPILVVMMEAFINGMETQERLSNNSSKHLLNGSEISKKKKKDDNIVQQIDMFNYLNRKSIDL